MFGRKLVRESEVRDCEELEQHIAHVVADNSTLRQANDQLSEANNKLTGEREDLIKQVIDLGTANKQAVNPVMLAALKVAVPYMHQLVNARGKADYNVILEAIKTGENNVTTA